MAKYMNTQELSQYLGINEKKIYTLIAEKKLPATKITGKWIFIKELVDMWIEGSVENYSQEIEKLKGILMIAGSNDLLLDSMVDEVKNTIPELYPYILNIGSLKGLALLKNGKAHISGAHLLNDEQEEYNLPFINSHLSGFQVTVINFAYRQQGLIIRGDNPLKIRGVEDLARSEVKFINRQKGSGTRVLLDSYLKKINIPTSRINGYEKEVNTHFEVGLTVLRGLVDVGLGIKAAAKMLGLGFIPLKKERFDILVPKHYFFFKEVQIFLEILKSSQFRRRASELGGYDTKDSGKIIYTN
jgi:excisionase family DNA binding protein